jgi:hypothetical protein
MKGNRTSRGDIKLTKGIHKIKVQYFQGQSGKGISLKWIDLASKDKKKAVKWLSADNKAKQRPAVVIDLTPTDGKTRMYHNFIEGSTHRTMGVGFPHGHNIAFSTQDCQPDVIWKGKFINAGKHWTGRGQGTQIPLSNDVVKLGQGVAWSEAGKDLQMKLIGYTMDKLGNPTFNYKAVDKEIIFSEHYIPNEKNLTRVITINASQDHALRLRLAKGQFALSGQSAVINEKLTISASPLSTENGELTSSVDVKKGTQTFKVIYSWKK